MVAGELPADPTELSARARAGDDRRQRHRRQPRQRRRRRHPAAPGERLARHQGRPADGSRSRNNTVDQQRLGPRGRRHRPGRRGLREHRRQHRRREPDDGDGGDQRRAARTGRPVDRGRTATRSGPAAQHQRCSPGAPTLAQTTFSKPRCSTTSSTTTGPARFIGGYVYGIGGTLPDGTANDVEPLGHGRRGRPGRAAPGRLGASRRPTGTDGGEPTHGHRHARVRGPDARAHGRRPGRRAPTRRSGRRRSSRRSCRRRCAATTTSRGTARRPTAGARPARPSPGRHRATLDLHRRGTDAGHRRRRATDSPATATPLDAGSDQVDRDRRRLPRGVTPPGVPPRAPRGPAPAPRRATPPTAHRDRCTVDRPMEQTMNDESTSSPQPPPRGACGLGRRAVILGGAGALGAASSGRRRPSGAPRPCRGRHAARGDAGPAQDGAPGRHRRLGLDAGRTRRRTRRSSPTRWRRPVRHLRLRLPRRHRDDRRRRSRPSAARRRSARRCWPSTRRTTSPSR